MMCPCAPPGTLALEYVSGEIFLVDRDNHVPTGLYAKIEGQELCRVREGNC